MKWQDVLKHRTPEYAKTYNDWICEWSEWPVSESLYGGPSHQASSWKMKIVSDSCSSVSA